MALPSETIATLCVSHLVKKLFQEFVDDMHKEAERHSQERDYNSIISSEVKVPAVTFFYEIGKLFDKELKHVVMGKKNQPM